MTTTFIMPSGEIVQDAMPVQCRRVVPWAKLPEYATPGSACFDLFAACTVVDVDFCALIDTGLEFAVPDGHVMMIYSRSGHGFKHGVRLSNCVGVIDSDYRGEVKVMLANDRGGDFRVNIGDRIAQGMIIPVRRNTFEVVDKLPETARGAGGMGSTGA